MIDTQKTEVAPQVLEQVQQYVAEHCPDLLDAECSVQARRPHSPSAEMLSKVQDQDAPATEQPKGSEVREHRPAYTVAAAPTRSHKRATVTTASASPHYTVTLRKNVRTDNGTLLTRILRFVVDSSGRILKATTSKLAATRSKAVRGGRIARLYSTP